MPNIVEAGRLLVEENKAHESEKAYLKANLAEVEGRALGSTRAKAGTTLEL